MRNFFSNVNEMVEKMAEIDVKKSIFFKKNPATARGLLPDTALCKCV